MDLITQLALNFFQLANEASPWLLLGLLIAGLMKTWVPTRILSKHLGHGKTAIVKAALIGAPLPLCSCGVIPVATQLRRSGASSPATASFLVATPETGVDSVSVSYALLGPIMAIYRPITAIISAIFTGFVVLTNKDEDKTVAIKEDNTSSCCDSDQPQPVKTSCCATEESNPEESKPAETRCCATEESKPVETRCCATDEPQIKTTSCGASNEQQTNVSGISKTITGVKYAFTQLIDDLVIWLFIGLLFATIVRTFLPTDFLLSYGSGLPAMLLMILVSIPMYICATASTPIAAGFILAGISPGTALVFMMAGPATNISTLGVIKHEMGENILIRYLIGISISAITSGLLLDFALTTFDISINEQMSHSHELLPTWFAISCTLIIFVMAIKPLRRLWLK